jgi:hypothetical protein
MTYTKGAALYAREQFGPEVDIKIFEKASRVGGRVQDTIIEGIRYSIIPIPQATSEFNFDKADMLL